MIAECLGHVAPKAYTIGDGTFYPHRPVRLLLRAKARNKVVRQLNAPAGFGAVLPLGPPGRPKEGAEVAAGQSRSSEQRGKDYARLITKIEEELCFVGGLGAL